ncbi:MAG: hypothetical protein N2595_00745 [bacterium]|nr:hypothetical protein [bacterium]
MNAGRRWRIAVWACAGLALVALGWKVSVSEQVRIAWNAARYFYDGRHKLDGDARAVWFDLAGELWVRARDASGMYVRIIPQAGVELVGEQSVSFVSGREGVRRMYKLRPQRADEAARDTRPLGWEAERNEYRLYGEQRVYSNEVLVGYYKDFAYGAGGIFFVDPRSGERVAGRHYSTVYVPAPSDEGGAGPREWLWAAAANRGFVEASVTGSLAREVWDRRYVRVAAAPSSRWSPGEVGMMAWDGTNVYLYVGSEVGWVKLKVDEMW